MRICLVSQEYPPETAKGGIGTQTYLKAHGLAAMGHEVYVLSRSPCGRRTETQTGRVQVLRLPAPADRFPVHTELVDWLSYSVEVAAAASELAARVKLELIDFPEWGGEAYAFLLNRTRWHRVPVAIHLHGPLVMFAHALHWPALDSEFYRVGTFIESTCLRLADAVYSSSRCSVDWCAKHYGLDAERTPVIHTGIDTVHFAPGRGRPSRRPTIAFVGRVARNKGVFDLLAASAALAGEIPGLHLRILGRGEPKVVEELRSEASRLGVEGILELVGYVSREELPEQLTQAHVFAAPSVYEGGPGFVYLEAMACGLPVIACAGSGAAEVIQHGENGLLVAPRDVPALTAALRSLLGDPGRREEMGRRARRFVSEEAERSRCLQRIEAFFTTVAARTAATSA
ncbi:MAG: glycosyltransferase family 4 protein [Verrucomicrobia bacterium]|nr:glycosyltransferase family 4 protein [Verrucomicrobiota bacterium]